MSVLVIRDCLVDRVAVRAADDQLHSRAGNRDLHRTDVDGVSGPRDDDRDVVAVACRRRRVRARQRLPVVGGRVIRAVLSRRGWDRLEQDRLGVGLALGERHIRRVALLEELAANIVAAVPLFEGSHQVALGRALLERDGLLVRGRLEDLHAAVRLLHLRLRLAHHGCLGLDDLRLAAVDLRDLLAHDHRQDILPGVDVEPVVLLERAVGFAGRVVGELVARGRDDIGDLIALEERKKVLIVVHQAVVHQSCLQGCHELLAGRRLVEGDGLGLVGEPGSAVRGSDSRVQQRNCPDQRQGEDHTQLAHSDHHFLLIGDRKSGVPADRPAPHTLYLK